MGGRRTLCTRVLAYRGARDIKNAGEGSEKGREEKRNIYLCEIDE